MKKNLQLWICFNFLLQIYFFLLCCCLSSFSERWQWNKICFSSSMFLSSFPLGSPVCVEADWCYQDLYRCSLNLWFCISGIGTYLMVEHFAVLLLLLPRSKIFVCCPPKTGEMRPFPHWNYGKREERYFCLQGKKDYIFLIQLGNAQKACFYWWCPYCINMGKTYQNLWIFQILLYINSFISTPVKILSSYCS